MPEGGNLKVLSEDEQQFVALVKGLDVEALRSFLDAHPDFDCNLVSPDDFFDARLKGVADFRARATPLFWVFCSVKSDTSWAEGIRHAEVVRLLVQRGADLHWKITSSHATLLHCLRLCACRFLIQLGADVNVPDLHGQTPLHYRAKSGAYVLVQTLLDAGARVNDQDSEGSTPLHRLLKCLPSGSRETFETLLNAHASMTVRDFNDTSPLDLLFRQETAEQKVRLLAELQDVFSARLASTADLASSVQEHFRTAPSDFTVDLPSSRRLEVHRWLLSRRSEKFRLLLNSGMKEAAEGVLVLKDVSETAFERLVEYAYGKDVFGLDWDDLAALVRLADEYLMPGLKQECQVRLCSKLSKDNVIDSLLLANAVQLPALLQRSIKMMAENSDEIILTERFAEAVTLPEFPRSLISDILRQSSQNKKRKRG